MGVVVYMSVVVYKGCGCLQRVWLYTRGVVAYYHSLLGCWEARSTLLLSTEEWRGRVGELCSE